MRYFCLLLPLLFVSCTHHDNPPVSLSASAIVIGHVDGLTGANAPYGNAADRGIAMAVEELNHSGGIKGRKIELISLDDQSKPSEAVTAATRLMAQDKAVAVIGESTSSGALAMAPIAQSYRVPMISPWATNVKVTQVGDFIFRVCYVDSFQGAVLAKFAAEDLKLKKVAILRDLNSDASVGLANFFTQAFLARGGKIVSDQSYVASDVDFRPQLTRLKAAGPDGIFLSGYYTEVGLIARQARELEIKGVLFGGDGWDSPELIRIAGASLEGSYFSDHYSADNSASEVRDFVSRFRSKYSEVPSAPAALGYDAARILFAAMEKAKQLDSTSLRDALARVQGFPGVTGRITIDPHRNAVKPAVVVQVKNGAFHYFSTVEPFSVEQIEHR